MAPRGVYEEKAAVERVSSVVLARQPIFDRRESVCAYELRYRPMSWAGLLLDPTASSASVIVSGFADIGLERLVGDCPAYIKVDDQFLLYVGELPLSADQLVLQLLGVQAVDQPLVRCLAELTGAGFQLAVDDFALTPEGAPLLELASHVKLDIGLHGVRGLAERLKLLGRREIRLIAENVDSREEHEACLELGFDAFQGRFYAAPRLVRARTAPTHRLTSLTSLIQAGPQCTFEGLEKIICEDPGLSHRFLRLANSAFSGPRSPVGSIRQALVRLGTAGVRRWVLLLSLAGLTDRPHHLLTTGLQRARLCELLAHEYPATVPERAFTVGLLSVLDGLVGRPMPELLAELPLDERLRSAITDRSGPEGRLLAAIRAYECGHFELCAPHGIRLISVARAYRSALDWADDTAALIS